MSLRPSSRTSATWVWPQQMTRASVRVAYCIVTAASRSAGRPFVWLPGEAWQASTSSSPTASRRSAGRRRRYSSCVVVELLARPLGGRAVARRDLVEPGEGGREVAVGDGDVGVAGDDQGAGLLELHDPLDDLGRAWAVEDEVARG